MLITVKRSLSRIKHYLDVRELPDLEASQYWSPDKQQAYQSERLVAIFRHHFENTPGYRTLCQQYGVDSRSISGIEDIERLPVIDRQWLQNNSTARNRRYATGPVMHTGGSTGEPLEYVGCSRYHLLRERAHGRGWGYFGLPNAEEFTVIASAQGRIATTKNLDGELNSENTQKIIQVLNLPGHEYVRGYASSIYIVARYMIQYDLRNNVVRYFNLISENVYDWQRATIQAAFPASEVYEEYCCNDGSASAWECQAHAGLHEAIERAIIEPSDRGEMIVTDLWNRAMPFIRYRNGDFLAKRSMEPCQCGRTLSRIKVLGRTNDILVTPSGPVSPTYLMLWGAGYGYTGAVHNRGFSQIQYVQRPGYILDVNLVKNEYYTDADLERLQEQVARICQGMSVEYHFVDQIETTPTGKRRFIINLDHELSGQWALRDEE
jgi:phenylacetate-CoA ligase